jgi:hypothetical protein
MSRMMQSTWQSYDINFAFADIGSVLCCSDLGDGLDKRKKGC